MKNGNFDIDVALVEAERLPEKRRIPAMATLKNCKDSGKCE